MIKAVTVAFFEIFFLVALSACLVRLIKIGIFPAGLLIAKKPVNTAIANNHRFSIEIVLTSCEVKVNFEKSRQIY